MLEIYTDTQHEGKKQHRDKNEKKRQQEVTDFVSRCSHHLLCVRLSSVNRDAFTQHNHTTFIRFVLHWSSIQRIVAQLFRKCIFLFRIYFFFQKIRSLPLPLCPFCVFFVCNMLSARIVVVVCLRLPI